MKGNFIVFEGIDGNGKDTQVNLLTKYLRQKNIPVETLTYPDFQRPIGSIIKQFLDGKCEFSPNIQMILYGGEMASDGPRIRKWLNQGITVIANRYYPSTIAFQSTLGVPREKLIKFSELMDMPKPDKILLIKISAETSIKRKHDSKGDEVDRFEKDMKLQNNISLTYEELTRDQVFGPWYVIDGEKPVEEVFNQIKKVLQI
jgi:dTMP kinase